MNLADGVELIKRRTCGGLVVLGMDGCEDSAGIAGEINIANDLRLPMWIMQPRTIGAWPKLYRDVSEWDGTWMITGDK